jgi:hypothetical protein
MTRNVKTRKQTASTINATGWTLWREVPGSKHEDFLNPPTKNGITNSLKTNIKLNYI